MHRKRIHPPLECCVLPSIDKSKSGHILSAGDVDRQGIRSQFQRFLHADRRLPEFVIDAPPCKEDRQKNQNQCACRQPPPCPEFVQRKHVRGGLPWDIATAAYANGREINVKSMGYER